MQAIESIINFLDAILNPILRLCKWLTTIACGGVFVVLVAGVFWRYVLNSSLPWYEEAARYLMVWMAFAAGPIALKQGGHAGVQVLHNLMPGRLKQLNWMIIFTIIGIVLWMLTWQGAELAWFARHQTPSSFDMPFIFAYGAMPFGAGIMLLITVEFWLRALLSIIEPRKYFFTGGVPVKGVTDEEMHFE